MLNGLRRFVRDLKELAECLRQLKQLCCPECRAAETLNCHSKLYGNDPAAVEGCCLRGQRVWCCNRGRRGGCGRTFSIMLAGVLPRHTFTAWLLWQLLIRLLAGASLKAAVEQLKVSFALETVYRLRRVLRQRLESIRPRLCREQQPPASSHADPLLQTVAHLRHVFPRSQCALSAFQLHFQCPFLG